MGVCVCVCNLDGGAMVMEVDHEKQVVYTEPLSLSPRDTPSLLAAMLPSQENTAQRLTSPIVSTHLNTRNIAFERYTHTHYTQFPSDPTKATPSEVNHVPMTAPFIIPLILHKKLFLGGTVA